MDSRGHYEEGDVLMVNHPFEKGGKMKVRAIKAKRDSDYCYPCVLFSYCRNFEGNSEHGCHCYTTIFEEVREER